MKYAAVALLLLSLTACGDAGDHFLEFRPTNSRVVPVAKITLSINGYGGQPGTYPLMVTAFEAHGNPVPAGQSYTHPILLTSGGPCVATFGAVNAPGTAATFSVPNTTTNVYVTITCTPGTVTASDSDMARAVTLPY